MASSSRSRSRQPALVAEPGDRDALDQLHHEVGSAVIGGAGVEDLGDVGVVHQGQGLALGPEPGEHLAAVHAGLDELERDRPPHRLGLLGHVDRAHAPLADRLEQLVRADDRAGLCDRRGLGFAGRAFRPEVRSSPASPRATAGDSRKLPASRWTCRRCDTCRFSSASPPQPWATYSSHRSGGRLPTACRKSSRAFCRSSGMADGPPGSSTLQCVFAG